MLMERSLARHGANICADHKPHWAGDKNSDYAVPFPTKLLFQRGVSDTAKTTLSQKIFSNHGCWAVLLLDLHARVPIVRSLAIPHNQFAKPRIRPLSVR